MQKVKSPLSRSLTAITYEDAMKEYHRDLPQEPYSPPKQFSGLDTAEYRFKLENCGHCEKAFLKSFLHAENNCIFKSTGGGLKDKYVFNGRKGVLTEKAGIKCGNAIDELKTNLSEAFDGSKERQNLLRKLKKLFLKQYVRKKFVRI